MKCLVIVALLLLEMGGLITAPCIANPRMEERLLADLPRETATQPSVLPLYPGVAPGSEKWMHEEIALTGSDGRPDGQLLNWQHIIEAQVPR